MDWIKPMEPVLEKEIIKKPGFIHQIKWDGIRGLTYLNNGVKIFNRSGRERTGFYPEVEKISDLFNGKNAIFDGEMVVFEKMRPSFHMVLTRDRLRKIKNVKHYSKKYPVNYIIFDLLYFNDKDITSYPLNERLEILRDNLTANKQITVTDDFDNGVKLFELMKQKNYEGIVSKKTDSPYIGGKKHKYWYKTKITKNILAVICGVKLKDDFPKSLILGIYRDERLVYVGKASIGLKDSDFRIINTYKEKLKQDKSPLSDYKNKKDVVWFNPVITLKLSFAEWTKDRSLRQPKIIGFSDRPAKDATGEEFIT